jgi:hypothetical protein
MLSSGPRPNKKGRMFDACSSLTILDLRHESCSEERESDCAMRGTTLVRWESRRRYSMSTGLIPKDVLAFHML